MSAMARQRRLLLLWASLSVTPVFAAYNSEDPQRLLQIVRETECNDVSSDAGNQAAAVLAKGGYSNQLLEILATTSGYCVMGTIAQTLREASLPVFEKRLRAEPDNKFLLGALSNIQSSAAGPLLLKVLQAHSEIESIAPILHALVANRVGEAVPVVKRRFESTSSDLELLKTEYALAIIGLGDSSGVSWLQSKIEGRTDSAFRTAEGLAWLAGSQPSFALLADETQLAPLLQGLAKCVSSTTFGDVCARTLEVLTRHKLPARGDEWSNWIAANRNRHPIYSKPLDNAVRDALATFRESLDVAGQKDPAVGDTAGFLREPTKGGEFLWRYDVNPALSASWKLKHGLGFDLLCGVALSSEVRVPNNLLFRKELTNLNLTVMVASSKKDKADTLIQAANSAAEKLEEYAKRGR